MKDNNYEGVAPTGFDVIDAIEKDKSAGRQVMVEYLLGKYHFATMADNKELYVYEDGIYVKEGEKLIHREMVDLWGEDYTDYHKGIVESIIRAKSYCRRTEFDNDLDRLCVQNGLINLLTSTLEDFSPERKFLSRLPVAYDPDADCPRIKKFLNEVLRPEDIPAIEEITGYCLHKDYPAAKSLMLIGFGRNGKTTLLTLIKKFLGERNVSSLNLHQLTSDKFAVAGIYGRLANICSETSDTAIECSDRIKSLTGGDWITVDVKFKKDFEFKNTAKMIFATNKLPIFRDDSHAFLSRWIIIDFPNQFEGGNDNKNLINELAIETELSGFLNIALKGLKRLRENKWEFTLSQKTRELSLQYNKLADNVKAFADEHIEMDYDTRITFREVYQAYETYCKRIRQKPVHKTGFRSRLVEAIPDIYTCKKGIDSAYANIRLKGNLFDISEAELIESIDKKRNVMGDKDKDPWS